MTFVASGVHMSEPRQEKWDDPIPEDKPEGLWWKIRCGLAGMPRRKKMISLLLVILLLAAGLLILFLSPIAKYLVEKYDTRFTGREILVGRAYVNPFTGYIKLSDLRIFENQSDTVFIKAKSLSADFALVKLLSGTYEIDHLWLEEPKITVIQNKDQLNFSDIIRFYTPPPGKKKTKKEPVRLNLLDMKIIKGEFIYNEQSIPVKYSVKDVNISSPGLRWDVDTMNIDFDFNSGMGTGKMKGDMMVNVSNAGYRLKVAVGRYDLRFLEQYLNDLANYGNFYADLDADLLATGNFKSARDIDVRGLVSLNDFHVGKKANEDYAAFDKLVLKIEQLNPDGRKYLFDSISLVKPFFTFELYDRLNNIETMFGEKGTKAEKHSEFNIIIEIGKYIDQLARNFFRSEYKINRLAVYAGRFRFNDFSLEEKFSVSADPVYIIADSVKRDDKPVTVSLKAGIQPYGQVSVGARINPKDSSDFDFWYDMSQIPLTLFNPYLIRHTSFPLDRGTLEIRGKWKVRSGIIAGDNRLTVLDPRIYKRVDRKGIRRLPLRLLTFFVRERGNVIDYEIPVTGDLKKPRVHIKDIVLDLLTNTFVKPVSTPYLMKVRTVEQTIEKSLVMRWEMRQSTLSSEQQTFCERLKEVLSDNPEAIFEIDQVVYEEKEKEHILLFEARKKYYLQSHPKHKGSLSPEEEREIERMSIKDSLFNRYLDQKTKGQLLFTVQEKCMKVVGHEQVEKKWRELLRAREQAFMTYFREEGLSSRIKLRTPERKIPYNGFSFYKIDYQGEWPGTLLKAYANMERLNDQSPRLKFREQRETRSGLIRSRNKRP
jgi:hypothetical protein